MSETFEYIPTKAQAKFLASRSDVIGFGGNAGGGKSLTAVIWLLGLNEDSGVPLYQVPDYRGMLFRKHFRDLKDIIDKTKKIYPLVDPNARFTVTDLTWTFSSGSKITLIYFETLDSAVTFLQGQEIQRLVAEESSQMETLDIWLYCMSRLRTSNKNIKPQIACTMNPSKNRCWKDYFQLDRYGSDNKFIHEFTLENGKKIKKSIEFIRARVQDNPHVSEEYQATLMMLGDADRKALLTGDWESYIEVENQVYESELKQLIAENRFCTVRHDPSVSVCTYFDLGINDEMVILFVQHVGKEVRIINMMHGRNKGLESHWIPEINKLASELNYQYHKHYLPHDSKQRDKFDAVSIESKMKSKLGNVEVLQRSSLVDGIQSTRSMFPNVWIDKTTCQDLLDGLQKYIREKDTNGNVKAYPIHSDIADAFRYVSYAGPKTAIIDITPGKSASPFTFTR